MQAIQFQGPKRIVEIEIDEPSKPGVGEALVATHRMGVCGTDTSAYLGKFPFFAFPRIPGHELGVEVLEIGEGVTNVKPGDRCSVEPYMNCGECYACRKGRGNCCANMQVLGVMFDGGLCERFTLKAEKLHPSDKLTYEQLALVETLAIGCHAAERGKPERGEHVLIIGAGPIGLAMLEFTRLTGAIITVMDMVESRLEFCKKTYDVSHTILFRADGSEVEQMQAITGGDKYALVCDATGNKHSMSGALAYVAQNGTLLYLGVTTEEISFPHPALHRPEMTIKGTRNALPKDFQRIISLIEQGTIDTAPWITHRTPLSRVVEDFDSFTKPENGVLKAMIELD